MEYVKSAALYLGPFNSHHAQEYSMNSKAIVEAVQQIIDDVIGVLFIVVTE